MSSSWHANPAHRSLSSSLAQACLLAVSVSVNGVDFAGFIDRAESRCPVHLTGARVSGWRLGLEQRPWLSQLAHRLLHEVAAPDLPFLSDLQQHTSDLADHRPLVGKDAHEVAAWLDLFVHPLQPELV